MKEQLLFLNLVNTLRTDLFKSLEPRYHDLCYDSDDTTFKVAEMADLDPRIVAQVRLFQKFDKKFIGRGKGDSGSRRDGVCWDTFLEANTMCKSQNEMFGFDQSELPIWLSHTLNRASDSLESAFWQAYESQDNTFLRFSVDNRLVPVDGFDSGKGSCHGMADGTSTLEKFYSDFQVSSSRASSILQFCGSWNLSLKGAIATIKVVDEVKASFVPKDCDRSRMVVPQNNGDLMLQYSVMNFLILMLKYFSIDLEKQQDINKEMARVGSLYDNLDLLPHFNRRNPRYSTIDLRSASDIIGTGLVKKLFNGPLFDLMDALRPTFLNSQQFGVCRIEAMATMGNAYCFPLQTLVFASIVDAIYWQEGMNNKRTSLPAYSVYGDDIIVDVTVFDRVCSTLRAMHMEPNRKKSFSHGHFRESCGGDFFYGVNVRAVQFEQCSTDSEKYSLANRLIQWSINHRVDLSRTIRLLLDCISYKCVVPPSFSDDSGLKIPVELLSLLPTSWTKGVRVSVLQMQYSHLLCSKDTIFVTKDNICSIGYLRDKNAYINYTINHIETCARKKSVPFGKRQNFWPLLKGDALSYVYSAFDDAKLRFVLYDRYKVTKTRNTTTMISDWSIAHESECSRDYEMSLLGACIIKVLRADVLVK